MPSLMISPSRAKVVRMARLTIMMTLYVLLVAISLGNAAGSSNKSNSLSAVDKKAEKEKVRQTRRVYSLVDHSIRICVYAFVSAVFAGLTLGVMCADVFTLEIIAESGPAPDCKYAAKLLPLRKKGHKTLCTLIISNMLCNVLIVQEFADVFDIIEAIRTHGEATHVVDDSGSALWGFIVSTLVIVIFAEIIPMSICKSKHSLQVAAAGCVFVNVAMVLTYPVSASLGWFLDLVVGTEETGQLYDKRELRKLMVLHYDRETDDGAMAKSELTLLLAAMDFHERKVRDIMTPIEEVTCVKEDDTITADFLEGLWKSGRSRVPVMSCNGAFENVLVVKDLMTVNTSDPTQLLTVSEIVRARNRLFAMVCENTSLPSMLKFFQDAATHMAVVFEEEQTCSASSPATEGDGEALLRQSLILHGRRANDARRIVGIVTMEDVVEELLNQEIYDEYDRYDPDDTETRHATVHVPPTMTVTPSGVLKLPVEPAKPPRVSFYSYFTHPEGNVPLTESQVWAVAYFLQRSVKSFYTWQVPYIKLLLDECRDTQMVAPQSPEQMPSEESPTESFLDKPAPSAASSQRAGSIMNISARQRTLYSFCHDHSEFLNTAYDDSFILYSKGIRADAFTLVLGGRAELLVGNDSFKSKLQAFDSVAEEALQSPFYVPDFSVVVHSAARFYRIPKDLYEKYVSVQSLSRERRSNLRILGPSPTMRRSQSQGGLMRDGTNSPVAGSGEKDSLLPRGESFGADRQVAYGTFQKKKTQ